MIGRKRSRETRIGNIRSQTNGSTHRVVADVDGAPMWFESDDVKLAAAPEAFGSAMLLVSLHHGRTLIIDAPVSSVWLENLRKLLPVWRKWWGYEETLPRATSVTETVVEPLPERALAFSGGVDSFYSILHDEPYDLLIAAQGFDIPLSDTTRMAGLRATLSAAAQLTGAKTAVIRTNFREHPSFGRGRLWERAHGGVLAAFGHVLKTRVGQLTISSSYGWQNLRPWGSSPITDPFFSSDRMRIVQFGADTRREDKIPAIADHPLVRQHLRVCWANRSPTGNCSRCGKCLMTMLALAELGVLDEFPVFDGQEALIERLNSTMFLWKHNSPMDRVVRRGKLEPRLEDAARRLVRRSRHARRLREMGTRLTYLIDRHA